MEFTRGMKVFTAIAGDKSPGLVLDPIVKPRQVITKQGVLQLPEAVEILSLRAPAGQDPFYVRRAEGIAWITARGTTIPAVDGPDGADIEGVLAALEREASESLLALQRKRAAAAGRTVAAVDWAKVGKTPISL